MDKLLEEWIDDPQRVKNAFIRLRDRLSEKENTIFTFISRPGVSYSLRAMMDINGHREPVLLALVDIIDDDPQNRWLSVCFYGEMITDPKEVGDLIPGGLFGKDGYCFDLFEYDEVMISYIEQRIDEVHRHILNCKI